MAPSPLQPQSLSSALIDALVQRRLAVITDDSSAPHRSCLFAPAEAADQKCVNSLISKARGLCFVAISEARISAFELKPMMRAPTSPPGSESIAAGSALPGSITRPSPRYQILESVEAREGVHSGISAADRACTIRVLAGDQPNPRQIVKPGHIFPVAARDGGVLVRNSIPEALIDIMKLAGFRDAAVFADILNLSGELASDTEVAELCASLDNVPRIYLSSVVRNRLESDSVIERVAEAHIHTRHAGRLAVIVYRSLVDGEEHVALVKGELCEGKIQSTEPILTRVQAEDTLRDVFESACSPCESPLTAALRQIGARDTGVLVYLRRPYNRQQFSRGSTELEAPRAGESSMNLMRDYGVGAQILRDLGVSKVDLITGSRKNLAGLKTFGIDIVAQRPIVQTDTAIRPSAAGTAVLEVNALEAK